MTESASPPKVRPKRHHYVPRLHLSRFVGDSPKNMIWTFDNQTSRWLATTVENTAVQSNFYSIETDAGPNDGIELLLSKIESDAATGYEMLLANDVPTGQIKADFAMFVATQYLRTPAMLNAVAAGQAELMDLQLDMLLRSEESFRGLAKSYERDTGKPLGDYEKLRSFVRDKSRYNLAVTQKLALSIIGAADDIAPLLYQREWTVGEALEGFFITSDHPVFRWSPPEEQPRLYGDGGFKNVRAEITFPLSPNKLLLMTAVDLGGSVVFDGEGVKLANEMRALAAERYVYSPRKDDEIAAIALEHKDELNRMMIGGRSEKERPNVKVVRRIEPDEQ